MTFELEVPEELDTGSGGNFLKKAGTYHVCVTEISDGLAPKKKSGEQSIIDGFSVAVDVLDGTVKSEVGKVANITFFNGKLTSKDQGRFARAKQTAFLMACNVIDPSKRGQKIQVDLTKAVGQQLVINFEEDPEQTNDKGEHYLRVAYANTYHVDDPRCEGIPKNAEALKMLPKNFRHDAAWFDQLKAKPGEASQSQSNGGGGASKQRETANAGPAKSNVSFDDL